MPLEAILKPSGWYMHLFACTIYPDSNIYPDLKPMVSLGKPEGLLESDSWPTSAASAQRHLKLCAQEGLQPWHLCVGGVCYSYVGRRDGLIQPLSQMGQDLRALDRKRLAMGHMGLKGMKGG